MAVFSLFTYRKAAQKAFKGFAWEDRKNLATVCLLFVWVFSVIGFPLLLAASGSKTIINVRYVIAASPPLYLLAAKGIRNINYSYAKLAVIAIIVILSAANLQTYYTTTIKAQAREATGFVNENAKNGDLVVFFSGSAFLIRAQLLQFRCRFECHEVSFVLNRARPRKQHQRAAIGYQRP